MQRLSTGQFKNEFVNHFPGDGSGDQTPRQTPGALYSKAIPTAVAKPELLAWSDELAEKLKIDAPDESDKAILGGNLVTPSMYPYAACYAGHQFGNWAGQLGDGRAITLGEWPVTALESWELQLKGAGRTAYSRRGDGRAVLRSSLREYLMSEAMHYLGVPTTRALGLVSTGEPVMRDMFYDGRPAYEPGAVVMRAAPSFLRFGNFEMLAARGETDNLKKLVDWTISRYYGHIPDNDEKILTWFRELVNRTASLMVQWQRVGFVHGVMNTDNMSVLGLTIDYGPFSFLDNYDPEFTPNTTDLPGRRYAFGQQPSIAYWNLGCLANALLALFPETGGLVKAVEEYEELFWMKYYRMMGDKLGLDELRQEDVDLFMQLENVLRTLQPDMTIFFQLLMTLPLDIKSEQDVVAHFQESFYQEPGADARRELYELILKYTDRLAGSLISREESIRLMKKANPRFVLRNYLLHQAIEELSQGNNRLFARLQDAIRDPYSDHFDEFFKIRPDWATQKAGCSMLSCSS